MPALFEPGRDDNGVVEELEASRPGPSVARRGAEALGIVEAALGERHGRVRGERVTLDCACAGRVTQSPQPLLRSVEARAAPALELDGDLGAGRQRESAKVAGRLGRSELLLGHPPALLEVRRTD